MAANNIPRHLGFIPDGNRRWAKDHGLPKEAGYEHRVDPGLLLYEKCKDPTIEEASIYRFTRDDTERPPIQKQTFSDACVAFALEIAHRGAAVLVVGDESSTQFPPVKSIPATPGCRNEGESTRHLWLGMRSGRSQKRCYVRAEYWPAFRPRHFEDTLTWFIDQAKTLSG